MALDDPLNLEARGAMLLGAHYAGLGIENAMLGAAHALANPLTAHYGIAHGLAVGMVLPHVVRYNATVVPDLYAELAKEAGLTGEDRPDAPRPSPSGLPTLWVLWICQRACVNATSAEVFCRCWRRKPCNSGRGVSILGR